MISYAQNFEDVILHRIFGDRPTGFYVDVGAADPEELSVTKWFYDQGWNGVNIEPNPFFHQRLVDARKRDTNLNCGAGTATSTATFYELPFRELSSFDSTVRDAAVGRGEEVTEHQIPILSLNEILRRHGGERHIDFLKIDVEGWERDVLDSIDLSVHRPTVILVEATMPSTSTPNFMDWEPILTSQGFIFTYFDGLNRFYIDETRQTLKSHFLVPPNVFDGYTPAEIVRLRYEAEQLKMKIEELKPVEVSSERLRQSESDGEARLLLLKQAELDLAKLTSQVRHLSSPRWMSFARAIKRCLASR
jgi:FkbM family methyltransferase